EGVRRIAARLERDLAAVKLRIEERDRILDQSDEDERRPVRAVVEGLLHRALAAGGVEDEIEQPLARRLDGLEAQSFDELAAVGTQVGGDGSRSGGAQKLQRRQADRPGPDDQRLLTGRDPAALDGVLPDAEGLDQGQLLVAQGLRLV